MIVPELSLRLMGVGGCEVTEGDGAPGARGWPGAARVCEWGRSPNLAGDPGQGQAAQPGTVTHLLPTLLRPTQQTMLRSATSTVPASQILRLGRTHLARAAARPKSALTGTARPASTQPSYHPNLERAPKKGIKVGYLFSGLALLGK